MEEQRKIRVVSDGTPGGTRVIDLLSGQELPATEVSFGHFDFQQPAEVSLTLVGVEVDAVGPLIDSREQGVGFWRRVRIGLSMIFPYKRRRRHTPQEIAKAIEIVNRRALDRRARG